MKPRAQAGFVLPAVLGLIVLLALGASALLLWLERVQQDAAMLQQRAIAERAFADARAVILHALAIEPLSARGLEFVPLALLRQGIRPYDLRTGAPRQAVFVRLDAQPYQLANGAVVRLQDARGLINLNASDLADFERLMQGAGIAPSRTVALRAALLDYVGAAQRLPSNAADAAPDRAAGRTPRRKLRDVGELALVPGFAEAPSLLDHAALMASLHAGSLRGIAVNSAPAPVLRAAGFDAAQVAALLARRRAEPIETMEQLQAVAGLAKRADPLRFVVFPGNEFRVEVEIGGRVQRFGVTLTPRAGDSPWRIDYSRPPVSVRSHGNPPEFAPLPFPDATSALPPS